MKTIYFNWSGLAFLCLALSFSSCHLDDFDEVQGLDYQAEFAIPLVSDQVSIQDLLDRSSNDLTFIDIEEDGSFTLSYQEEAEALTGEELMANLPAFFPIPVLDHSVSVPIYGINGVSFEWAEFQMGELQFDLTSGFQEDLTVSITIPGLTKNGQVFNTSASLNYSGSLPVQNTTPLLDLTGYVLSADDGSIQIEYEARNANGDNRLLDVVLGSANNWAFNNIQGNWDSVDFTMETDTLEFDIYSNLVEGDLNFVDPRLHIIIDNSFGVPVLARVTEMKVITADNEVINLESSLINEGFMVSAPDQEQQGEVRQSIFTLDRDNSNIDVIFNSRPKQVIYQIATTVAPGNTPTNGFVMSSSKLDVKVSFELPIYGTAKNFVSENSVEMDMGEELDNLVEAQFKLITENELPVHLGLQIYFLDADGQKLDSIFNAVTEVIVPNAPALTSNLDFTESRLDNIRKSKDILIHSEFSTTGQGNTPVRIFNYQELSVKLGLRATVKK